IRMSLVRVQSEEPNLKSLLLKQAFFIFISSSTAEEFWDQVGSMTEYPKCPLTPQKQKLSTITKLF
ncbi:hypothetical protein, partial [Klebsiella grimontii]|uniref:hypothetical protein n=1 Tax=Klebsiella grimontii TaxID=2058152 RepID=UPI001AD7F82D